MASSAKDIQLRELKDTICIMQPQSVTKCNAKV